MSDETTQPEFTERYQPGWYFKGQAPCLAVYEIPKYALMTNLEVEVAIVNGDFQLERVAGCRVVPLADVFRYVERRAAVLGEK
jgi:hypothetical protein